MTMCATVELKAHIQAMNALVQNNAKMWCNKHDIGSQRQTCPEGPEEDEGATRDAVAPLVALMDH